MLSDLLSSPLLRVFPRATKWTPTDDLAVVGWPGLFRPEAAEVHVSVTFDWDIEEGQRLARAWGGYYETVKIGGPAFDDAGGPFVPGRYLKPGITITSRGCPRLCPWCWVPKRSGAIRELPVQPGHIVQDDNLLACSRPHIEAVFDMLREQGRAVTFAGGIDAGLLRDWHRALFDSVKTRELWFACDSRAELAPLRQAAGLLGGIPERKLRCYVLMGYGEETLADAKDRVESVYKLGFLPFAQLYRGPGEREYDKDWKALARKWSRPAAYRRAAERLGSQVAQRG